MDKKGVHMDPPATSTDLFFIHTVRGWLKRFSNDVLLERHVFTNKDGSAGVWCRECGDLTCAGDQVTTIYPKRRKVVEFHKSFKSNVSLAKSPTRAVPTQTYHVVMSIYSFSKLKYLKLKHKINPFALRAKLYTTATQQAYRQLQKLKAA